MIPSSNNSIATHNFFMKENGDVYAFGKADHGQCATGSEENLFYPKKILNNKNIKSFVLSESQTFYLEKNGDLYGCGKNFEGQFGISNERMLKKFEFVSSNVKKVVASYCKTIIQKENGKIYTSQNDGFHEIEIKNVKDFSCGSDRYFFLTNKGEVWVFGNKFVAPGLDENKEISYKNPQLLLVDKKITTICSTYRSTFFLSYDDSNNTILKCFGANEYGELGLGHTNFQKEIAIISQFKNIKSIHCGFCHTFILLENGDIYGCGRNSFGELCLGHFERVFTNFTKVEIKDIVYIVSGYHTVLVNKNKEVFVCGSSNDMGFLGLGPDVPKINTPVKLDFDNLLLFQSHQLFEKWEKENHSHFGEIFKKKVLQFLLSLKNFLETTKDYFSKKLKVPKQIQQMIINFVYKLENEHVDDIEPSDNNINVSKKRKFDQVFQKFVDKDPCVSPPKVVKFLPK